MADFFPAFQSPQRNGVFVLFDPLLGYIFIDEHGVLFRASADAVPARPSKWRTAAHAAPWLPRYAQADALRHALAAAADFLASFASSLSPAEQWAFVTELLDCHHRAAHALALKAHPLYTLAIAFAEYNLPLPPLQLTSALSPGEVTHLEPVYFSVMHRAVQIPTKTLLALQAQKDAQ